MDSARGAWIRAAFDPRGRVSARAYRRAFVRAFLACASLLCLTIWLAGLDLRILAFFAFGGNLVVLLALAVRSVRRLHDRGRSSAWLAICGIVFGASTTPIELAADRHPLVVIGSVAAIVGFFAWFFVEMFLRPGTPGPNRFGSESADMGRGSPQ